MKRLLIYVLPILLIILGVWMFINQQGNENIIENQEQKIVPTNTDGNKALPVNVAVSNEQSKVWYLAPIYDVNVKNDIVYASKKNETEIEEALKFDLYEPTGDNNKLRPVFIFIHGGGYTGGGKYDTVDISTKLAKRGYAVLSMDYRLKNNPNTNFARTLSDASEDIVDVIGWINKNAASYGLDAGHIAIGGDSAGGHLSINFVNEYLKNDPSIVKPIFAIIDIYGGLLINKIQEKLPPVLIIHGTIDQIVPYQQSLQLNDALAKLGIYHNLFTMEDVGHDYKNAKYIDEIVEWTSHFLWNVMNQPKTEWLPENTGIVTVSGDQFDINLPEGYTRNPAEGEIKVILPKGWLLDKNEGGPSLHVQVPENLDRGNNSISVSLDQGQEVAPGFAINVKVIDPLKESFETYFDSTDHKIKTNLKITNQSKNNFSGSLQVAYETEQASQGTFSTSVDQLGPGKAATFNIPELAREKRIMQVFSTSDTLLQTTEDLSHALLLHKLQKPIHIDGNLEEWKDQVRFDVNEVVVNGWTGIEDTSAVGYLSWDVNNLYLAVEVTDDKQAQNADDSAIWSGDSVQLAIGIANADGSVPVEYHELGVAMNDNGNLSKWRWLAPEGFSTDGTVAIDYAISRKNQKTIYEMASPWNELTKDTKLVKQGMKLKFSLLVNDDDGNGSKRWLEFNSGIRSDKDINAFGDLYLAD
jgi:acetyl esterase/lipase